jgi:hypothetical protein
VRRYPLQLRRAAIHEAGHAVIGRLYGYWVREKGILIREDGTGFCDTRAQAFPGELALYYQHPTARQTVGPLARARVALAVAGAAAEWRYRGVPYFGIALHWHTWRDQLAAADPHIEDDVHAAGWTLNEWTALTGADPYQVGFEIFEHTQRLLGKRVHWQATRALARELAERRHIDGEEVDDMLEAAGVEFQSEFPPVELEVPA